MKRLLISCVEKVTALMAGTETAEEEQAFITSPWNTQYDCVCVYYDVTELTAGGTETLKSG